mmetsp:Transcript_13760/g.18357  ORF Transcript_13760/g.18357 Transcript_13760/m.18357 type:complete len:126 (+) Transcript_13760:2781-3158(+)
MPFTIACKPLEQKRFTVEPDVVAGHPAYNAALRPILNPVTPSGNPHPAITSSTSSSLTFFPVFSTALRMHSPNITAPWVEFKPPRYDLAKPVLAVLTTTAFRYTITKLFKKEQPEFQNSRICAQK